GGWPLLSSRSSWETPARPVTAGLMPASQVLPSGRCHLGAPALRQVPVDERDGDPLQVLGREGLIGGRVEDLLLLEVVRLELRRQALALPTKGGEVRVVVGEQTLDGVEHAPDLSVLTEHDQDRRDHAGRAQRWEEVG